MFIGGYKSGIDKSATVSFGRASFTDTGEGLHDGSEREHSAKEVYGVYATIKDMPASIGLQRIGAFYCEAEKDGDVERINTIIMAKTSKKLTYVLNCLTDVRYGCIQPFLKTVWLYININYLYNFYCIISTHAQNHHPLHTHALFIICNHPGNGDAHMHIEKTPSNRGHTHTWFFPIQTGTH